MNQSHPIAFLLIAVGIILVLAGLFLFFGPKIPFLGLFGHLPGDIRVEKENFRFYFPLTTSILLSIILSLIFYLVQRIK